ncbi:hypothetical protein [Clostridium scatologenes]|uniref:Uncharacterized protein n=1 Tax=Clostridium scatologenes TaxID=1548 RepID=A0A0E3JY21_CLOSL|nr:hypothetical protein [Clostridium scatologenes]AKA68524.1 hypothetical protein CSCA_1399 [Clostridium scatologenes]
MQINENFKIEAIDDRNICILKKQSAVSEDEKWKRIGYYSTPQGALKGIVNKEIIGTGLKDFKTVCNKIEELYKYINSLDIQLTKEDKSEDMLDFLGE